jgi:fibronectin-binding autotransporter adhesin
MFIGVLDRRLRRALMLCVTVLATALWATGAAHAAVHRAHAKGSAKPAVSCTTSWTSAVSGNWNDSTKWTNGVPTSTCAASITVAGTYTVTASAQTASALTLTLGGTSGTQTLLVQATDTCGGAANAALSLTSGGSVGAKGVIELTQSGNCGGGTAYLETGSAALSSAGTLETVAGPSQSNSDQIDGAFISTGSISIGYPTILGNNVSNSSLDNKGALSLAQGDTLTAVNSASVTDDTGGSISTGGGTGQLILNGGTYTQGAGTTSPATLDPTNPAVLLNGATLDYTGSGASSIIARGSFALSGSLAAGQNLTVQAYDNCGGADNSEATATSSFTNAGTIQLTQAGNCSNGTPYLEVSSPAVLTNSGTIRTDPGPDESATAYIDGALINTGTFAINAPSALGNYISGSSLDNKGTLSLATGETLNTYGGATVTDDTGGSISNGTGTGQMILNGGTYTQGAGTTSPATLDPTNPAVLLSGTALNYTGSGASSIIARGSFALSGSLAAGQNLTVQAYDNCGGATNSEATASASFTNAGTIQLTQAGNCSNGTPYLEVSSPAVLTNSGTIRTDPGPDESATAYIDGALINTGTFAINAPSALGNYISGSSLDNKGALSLATGETLNTYGGATVTDDTGGSISNGTGTGVLSLNGGTYDQGAGTISQTNPVPANPAVILSSTALKVTGKGKGTIVARGSFAETGNLVKGQDLVVQGTDFCGGATSANMTPSKSLTNTGVITLAHAGNCGSDSIGITLGTKIKLTNMGTISGATSRPEEISGILSNSGTVTVAAGDTLELSGTLSNVSAAGVLKGGIYTLAGTFQYVNSAFDTNGITDNDGTITLSGSGAFTDGNNANALRNLATNAKKLTLSGGEGLTTSASLTDSGTISLGGGSTLTVAGGYTQTSKGILATTLASASSYGQLTASGPSSLAGTFDIDQTYDATAGTSETVLSSSARTGTFTKVVVKNTGGKGSATPVASYTPTGVTVTG